MTGVPLSAAQAGIWAGQRLDPASPVYNTAERITIHGPVDAAAFDAALREVLGEAEALHARFVETAEGPRQVLDGVPDLSLDVRDLTAEVDPRAAADAVLRADLDTPVDLTTGPVFGQALVRTGPEEWVWGQRIHHIAIDGYGFSLLSTRVAQRYTALVADGRPGRPFAPFAPVLAADAAYAAGAECARDGAYWRELLADRPRPVGLTGRTAPPSRTFLRGGADLAPSIVDRLRAVAEATGGDWPAAVIAAVACYLHRATGATDLVLGLPVMCRLGSPALRVPCLAMNIVPLRVLIRPADTFGDLVGTVAAAVRQGRPHHRYRYERLRRDLRLVGGDRRLFGPVVNVMPFDYDLRFAGHRATAENLSAGPVEDLSVGFYQRAGAVSLHLDANPEIYSRDELAEHLAGLTALLAAAAPDLPVALAATASAASASVPAATGSASVASPSAPAGEVPAGPSSASRDVWELIEERAAGQPDRVAVRDGADLLTYAGLLARAARIAHALAGCGVGRGDLVAVALPRGADAVAAFLGVLRAGAAYLPLDPGGPAGRAADVLADARPALLLTRAASADRFPGPALVIDELPAYGPAESRQASRPADPAYVIYTSGSTGRANGVVVSRGALAHFVAGATAAYGIGARDVVLQFAPLHFDASVEEIFLTLCAGGELVSRADEPTSVSALLTSCAQAGVTVLDLPTAYWHEVAYAVSTGAATLPPTVRLVIIGGEAALAERVRRWRAAVGSGVRLLNTYGPTEATVVATYADLTAPDPDDAVPIGRPLPGVGVAVLDPAGVPVPDGRVGELYLTGGGLATGYLRRPERDAERFGPLAAPGRPRAYRTGDLVRRRPDGQLVFAGRSDDELKISGHRVDPAEVETVLLRHPAVVEAAVVGQPTGAGGLRLVAHVVPADRSAPPPPAALRAHVRATLPAAMVPAAVAFADRLPVTSTGKIDRAVLRASAVAAAPAAEVGSPVERLVMAAFREVLGVAEVAVDDDFFDLGGESLQTIQAANRLSAALGRDVPVTAVFQHPTPAALGAFLDAPAAGIGTEPDTMLADAVLPDDIAPRGSAGAAGPVGPAGSAQRVGAVGFAERLSHVLLTGGTGFVGVHLLARLLAETRATVTCLVRADDAAQAAERVRTALREHRLAADWPVDRLRAVPADLSRQRLGLDAQEYAYLAASCDTVLHAAASVSVVRGYASMRAVNVAGTVEILRLAAAVRPAAVHHVSTIAVGPPERLAAEVPEQHVPAHAGLVDGYQRSKWAAEQLVRQAGERGLPVAVYRLGRVVGASDTGVGNPRDLVWRLLRASVRAGAVPHLDVSEVWTPVDHVARTLVALVQRAPADGTVYHLTAAEPVRFGDVADWLRSYGYRLPAQPLPRWRSTVVAAGADEADLATLAFFGVRDGVPADAAGAFGRLVTENAAKALPDSPAECPAVGRAEMHAYLDRAVADGQFPAP